MIKVKAKLLVDVADVETEVNAAVQALRAMETGIQTNEQLIGQIHLVKIMLQSSLMYLAQNSLKLENGKITDGSDVF